MHIVQPYIHNINHTCRSTNKDMHRDRSTDTHHIPTDTERLIDRYTNRQANISIDIQLDGHTYIEQP